MTSKLASPCDNSTVLYPGAGVDPPQSLRGISAGEANMCRVFGGDGRAGTLGAAATPRAADGGPARPAGWGAGGAGGHEEQSGSERRTTGWAAGERQDADGEEQRQEGGEVTPEDRWTTNTWFNICQEMFYFKPCMNTLLSFYWFLLKTHCFIVF